MSKNTQIINLNSKNDIKKELNDLNDLNDFYKKIETFEQKNEEYKKTFVLWKPFQKGSLDESMKDAISAIGNMSKAQLFLLSQAIETQKVLKQQNGALYNAQLRIEEETEKIKKLALDLRNLIEEFLKLKSLRMKDIQEITNNINNYQEDTNKIINQKFEKINKQAKENKEFQKKIKNIIKFMIGLMAYLFLSHFYLYMYVFKN